MLRPTYKSHPWLRSGHIQTLMVGLVWGECYPHNAANILVDLDDGESLVVHEELGPPLAVNAPVVILIHGLGGDHSSPYLQRTAHRLRNLGKRVWRVDLRGSGHGLTLAWQPAHAGRSRDLAAVVEAASRRYPQSQIHLVGFSLSGNIVLKMLGERWHETAHQQLDVTRLGSALAVAPPIDLHACADNMDRFSRSIYTRYYLRVLDAQVQLRKSRWPQWHQVPAMPPIKTIRQFDARYTAPLSGFSSTDHYYTEASSKDLLAAIQTPTTLLIDRHDPIVAYPTFAAAKINPRSTQVITTSHGGHMGYFGIDATNRLIRWLEYFVAEHVKAHTGRKSLS